MSKYNLIRESIEKTCESKVCEYVMNQLDTA